MDKISLMEQNAHNGSYSKNGAKRSIMDHTPKMEKNGAKGYKMD